MEKEKLFTQEEVNRIVADRLLRERDKQAKLLMNLINMLSKAAETAIPDFSRMPYDMFEAYMTRYMEENQATADEFGSFMQACTDARQKGGVK